MNRAFRYVPEAPKSNPNLQKESVLIEWIRENAYVALLLLCIEAGAFAVLFGVAYLIK